MKKLLMGCLSILLVGCSAATTYHARDFMGEGYGEYRLAQDRFTVTFRANEYTEIEDVKKFALRRASEVATNYGYRYFTVEDERDLSRKSIIKSKEEIPVSYLDLLDDTKRSKNRVIEQEREVHKPAIELMIKCYHDRPKKDVIDAYQFLAYQTS